MTRRLFLAAALLLLAFASQSFALETKARTAMVLDYKTGTVLLEKNADASLPPASMSKLMTLYMVFEALKDGRLTLDEKLPVSQFAMSYKGSSMFLNTRDRVRVEDLIRGVIIMSGNDATVVLAEALAGSEAEFARSMTAKAKVLGMKNSKFANSNGWPDDGQRMSARDLVILAAHLIRDFPEYYPYFSEKSFVFDGRTPANTNNRNPLLKLGIGADGLKTGHTDEAGFGLVGSAVKGERRIIVMISGLGSAADRSSEAEKLINWGFRQFVEKKVLSTGDKFGSAEIWLGEQRSVELEAADDLTLLLPAAAARQLKAVVTVMEPVEAPIEKGQRLGTIKVSVPDQPDVEIPLLATNDVAASGFMARFRLSASLLSQKLMGLVN
ncbi:MAG: D-alanyl-D-alanine carboxypeptidase [Alphaproteobacteria bacterium]|nr:D-alanyl-D-alanine carboxypeptidase [Alphaproteobacteria bacterium]